MNVQALKSAFFQAGGNLIPTGDAAALTPVVYVRAPGAGVSQGPPAIVSYANGAKTPADTPEVQAAKASHNMKVLAAKSAFRQAGGNLIPTGDTAAPAPVVYARAPGAGVSQGPPAIVSHENGAITPADTPAVQAAKASHNMEVQAAKSAFRQAGGNLIPTGDAVAPVPVVYARAPGAGASQGPPAIVSHENGAITSADTPAVQAAKASHNMKVQAAKSVFRQAGGNLISTGDASASAPGVYARAPSAGVSQGPPATVHHANGAIVP